jgi:hypothetical protein
MLDDLLKILASVQRLDAAATSGMTRLLRLGLAQ